MFVVASTAATGCSGSGGEATYRGLRRCSGRRRSAEERLEVSHRARDEPSAARAELKSQPRFQSADRLGRDAELWLSLHGHGIAQKFALPRPCDRAPFSIDPQPEACREETLQRRQRPRTGGPRPHVHIALSIGEESRLSALTELNRTRSSRLIRLLPSSVVSGGCKFDSCGGRKSDSRQHGLAAG